MSRTLYYPSKKRCQLEVEVTPDGEVESAIALISYLGEWIDVKDLIMKDEKQLKAIREDAASLVWTDDDEGFESHKDFLIESKQAGNA